MHSHANCAKESGAIRLFRSESVAWIALVAIAALCAFFWKVTSDIAQQRANDRFQYRAEQIRQEIEHRLEAYAQVLRGGAALFDSSEKVTRDEWRLYIARLELARQLPGIQGTGFSLMISPVELKAHEQSVREEGFKNYAVRPSGTREQYSSIVYLEPFDWRNQRAFGYDMFSEPVRRKAMEYARDTGQTALSAKVKLVQETEADVQAGFLLYLPVYRHGSPLGTVEQRRKALIGFVYSPFRAQDMLRALVTERSRDADLVIYDGDPHPDRVLFDSRIGIPEAARGRYFSELSIEMGGHRWTAHFQSRKAFDQAVENFLPSSIAAGGALVALLVFAILTVIARSHRALERVAGQLADSEDRLKTLVRSLPDFVFVIDQAGRWSYFHAPPDRAREFRTLEEGIGQPFATLLPGAIADTLTNAIDRLRRNPAPHQFDATVIRSDREVSFDVLLSRLQKNDGEITGYLGVARDVTDEKAVRARERLLVSALEAVGNGVVITDPDGRIEWANSAYEKLSGYIRSEILGRSPGDLVRSGQQNDDFYASMWATILAGEIWRGELVNRKKDGSLYDAELTIAPILNDAGAIRHYVGIQHDISVRKRLEAELENLATLDTLTGLPNRRYFLRRLEEELARIQRHEDHDAAVMMLDLDHFKLINDQRGHAAGDATLSHFAGLLRDELRKVDSAGRLGGEEFAVLLPDTTIERAQVFADRLRDKVERLSPVFAGEPIPFTVSIGITSMNPGDTQIETVLARADEALYRAKNAGRNQVQIQA